MPRYIDRDQQLRILPRRAARGSGKSQYITEKIAEKIIAEPRCYLAEIEALRERPKKQRNDRRNKP